MDRLDYRFPIATATLNKPESPREREPAVRVYRTPDSGAVLQIWGMNTKGPRMLPTGTIGFASAPLTLKDLYTLRAAVDLAIADIERG